MIPRPARIETPRLVLRPLERHDLDAFHGVNADPAVARHLFDGRPPARAQSAALLDASRVLLERAGHGLFGVRLRDGEAMVGWAGYLHSHDPPVLEVAYALLPAWWGRGLAVEATRGVMTWGAARLGIATFRASTDAPNRASVRVLEKLGFRETTGRAELLHFVLDAAGVDRSGVLCVAA